MTTRTCAAPDIPMRATGYQTPRFGGRSAELGDFDRLVDECKAEIRRARRETAEIVRKLYADDMRFNLIAIGVIGLMLYLWS